MQKKGGLRANTGCSLQRMPQNGNLRFQGPWHNREAIHDFAQMSTLILELAQPPNDMHAASVVALLPIEDLAVEVVVVVCGATVAT